MASPEVAIICVACASDISEAKGRRLLCTEASSDVKTLWIEIFDRELARRGISPQGTRLVMNGGSGRMCRRCFTVYERCKKLLDSLKKDVCKVVDKFQRANAFIPPTRAESLIPTECPTSPRSTYSVPPAPKRLAVATGSSASPTVVVCANFDSVAWVHNIYFFVDTG